MASWPAGHRWEDYQVKVYDKAFAELGALGTVHNLRGAVCRWGQYDTNLTFSLEWDDPWTSVLNEKEVHFVNVIRDGTSVWGGYQVKLDRDHDKRKEGEEKWVEFEFLPLARMLGWRHGYESSADFLKITGVKVDDAFKDIVEKTLGATAPNTPTSGHDLTISALAIAADKTEHGDQPDLHPARNNIYEWMQERGVNYDVDWDIYWNGATPTFETWYPRRGTDRTEGNGSNAECIFNDSDGTIVKQKYGWDTADAITGVYSANMTKDVVTTTAGRTSWLLRMRAIDSNVDADMDTELANNSPKLWYEIQEFQEQRDKQWGTHFAVGDKCTWMSHEFGYGPNDDVIGKIEFEIDADGFEHLNLILGDIEPDLNDKMRGGGARRRRTRYTEPTLGAWNLRDDADTRVYPDTAESIGIKAADTSGNSYTVTSSAGGYQLMVDGPWRRDTSGANFLYPKTADDDLKIVDGGSTPVIWMEGDSGEAHLAGNMYLGSASTNASQRLHLYGTGGAVWARWQGGITTEVGVDASSIGVWQTLSDDSMSIRPNQTEALHINSAGLYNVNGGKFIMDDGAVGAGNWSFYVDPGVPSLFTKVGMTFIHEGTIYRWPTDAPAENEALIIGTAAATNLLAWGNPTAKAHDLLTTATHGDTANAVVQQGDLIIGDATPRWQRLAMGAANSVLASGAIPAWDATPTVTSLTTTSDVTIQGAHCYLTNTNTYVWGNGTSTVVNAATGGNVNIQVNAVNQYYMNVSGLRPAIDSARELGSTTLRWSNGYIDDLIITTHATVGGTVQAEHLRSLDDAVIDDLLTIGAGALVVNTHLHVISGDTASGQPAGAINVRDANNAFDAWMMYRNATPGAYTHVYCATDGAGGGAAWIAVTWQVPEIDPGEIAHTHGVGTLVNAGPSAP